MRLLRMKILRDIAVSVANCVCILFLRIRRGVWA
jgi:hypothetical protein